jgi:hypothetical protein
MKIFLLQPRQTGKTTKAVYEFLKNPNNTLYITHNIDSVKHIKDLAGLNHKNIISQRQFLNNKGVRNIDTIILDEYLFFEKKGEVYKTVKIMNPENIYVYSTANKVYPSRLFNGVKKYKYTHTLSEIIELYSKNYSEEEISELYFNFITDSDFKIIDTFKHTKDKQDLLHIIGEESYRLEVLNNYLN